MEKASSSTLKEQILVDGNKIAMPSVDESNLVDGYYASTKSSTTLDVVVEEDLADKGLTKRASRFFTLKKKKTVVKEDAGVDETVIPKTKWWKKVCIG
jgi:hypothetical protein